MTQRPMHMELRPAGPVRAARGTALRCKTWEAEAALRMLENNISPEIALLPEDWTGPTDLPGEGDCDSQVR